MLTVFKCFDEESDKIDFIYESEDVFEAELNRVAEEVRDEEGLKVITLSGPTCSGKTTTSTTLIRDLNRVGQRVKLISIDDFFIDRSVLVEEAKRNGESQPDLETIKSIDFDYFAECVDNINNDRVVNRPIFDFVLGKRNGYEKFDAAEYDVVLFEGIQAIYPEITALFANHPHKSIFISVAQDLKLNGMMFTKRDIRFLRRLVRDFTYRAASPEYTYKLWKSVAANEDKNIMPYAGGADVTISSLLPYELFVIKPFALTLLSSITESSPYWADARLKASKLAKLETINADYVPVDSVFREFIGPRRR